MKRSRKRGAPAKHTAARSANAGDRRGPLKSMRVSAGFRTFVLDQLSSIADLRAKPMFGGFGLYAGDWFFGILAADTLYFKVDETNRSSYEAANAQAFHPFENRPMSMSYFAVPIGVIEAAPVLADWAEGAIAVARASRKSPKQSAASRQPRRKR
jgi:DNA transformation protein